MQAQGHVLRQQGDGRRCRMPGARRSCHRLSRRPERLRNGGAVSAVKQVVKRDSTVRHSRLQENETQNWWSLETCSAQTYAVFTVRLSVCLANAWIVTKRYNRL